MNIVLSILFISIPTNLKYINKLKKSVEFMRIWADGEPDQMNMYIYTHNLLKDNNITDEYLF